MVPLIIQINKLVLIKYKSNIESVPVIVLSYGEHTFFSIFQNEKTNIYYI